MLKLSQCQVADPILGEKTLASSPILSPPPLLSSSLVIRETRTAETVLDHWIDGNELLAFDLTVTNPTEPPSRLTLFCNKLSAICRAPKRAMIIWTMMTSQDGIPVPGPCIFRCPCSAAIVFWKPSTCSESRMGVLRQVAVAKRMCGREDDVSTCCMKVQLVWCKTYHHCRTLCFGVVGDCLNGRSRWRQ